MKSIIRHSLLLLFVILLMPGMTNAKKIQRAEFRCTLDDFHISYKDSLVRVSGRLMASFNDAGAPYMPSLCYCVPIPAGMRCIEFRYKIPDTVTVCENRILSMNPDLIGYSRADIVAKYGSGPINTWGPCTGLTGTYPGPDKKIKYYDNGFIIYPFDYYPETETLTFTPTIIVDMVLEPIENVNCPDRTIPGESDEDEDGEEIIKIFMFEGNDERVYSPQSFKRSDYP